MTKAMTACNKNLVIKSNDLINARYQLTYAEMRIILLMISLIHKDDDDFKDYRIYIKDFMNEAGTKHKGEYTRAREITKELMKKVLEIPTEKGYTQVAWIAGAKHYNGEGHIDISFHPFLKPYLLNLKERFTKYDIKFVLSFHSPYSIRIYELLKQYEKIKERTISVDELKGLLKLEDKYRLYGHFKKRVIHQAQKDLEKSADIYFTFKEIKRGRKVRFLKFRIVRK